MSTKCDNMYSITYKEYVGDNYVNIVANFRCLDTRLCNLLWAAENRYDTAFNTVMEEASAWSATFSAAQELSGNWASTTSLVHYTSAFWQGPITLVYPNVVAPHRAIARIVLQWLIGALPAGDQPLGQTVFVYMPHLNVDPVFRNKTYNWTTGLVLEPIRIRSMALFMFKTVKSGLSQAWKQIEQTSSVGTLGGVGADQSVVEAQRKADAFNAAHLRFKARAEEARALVLQHTDPAKKQIFIDSAIQSEQLAAEMLALAKGFELQVRSTSSEAGGVASFKQAGTANVHTEYHGKPMNKHTCDCWGEFEGWYNCCAKADLPDAYYELVDCSGIKSSCYINAKDGQYDFYVGHVVRLDGDESDYILTKVYPRIAPSQICSEITIAEACEETTCPAQCYQLDRVDKDSTGIEPIISHTPQLASYVGKYVKLQEIGKAISSCYLVSKAEHCRCSIGVDLILDDFCFILTAEDGSGDIIYTGTDLYDFIGKSIVIEGSPIKWSVETVECQFEEFTDGCNSKIPVSATTVFEYEGAPCPCPPAIFINPPIDIFSSESSDAIVAIPIIPPAPAPAPDGGDDDGGGGPGWYCCFGDFYSDEPPHPPPPPPPPSSDEMMSVGDVEIIDLSSLPDDVDWLIYS